jgi:hypothetical protein
LLLKPTGEMYKPNWTTNGIIYLKSLYFTFKAATYNPTLKLATNARKRNNGTHKIVQSGTKLYHIISTISIINEIKKSTRFTIIVLTGMINLGKYNFVSIFELPIKEALASEKEVEKNCHGSNAEYTRMG